MGVPAAPLAEGALPVAAAPAAPAAVWLPSLQAVTKAMSARLAAQMAEVRITRPFMREWSSYSMGIDTLHWMNHRDVTVRIHDGLCAKVPQG